MNNKVLVTGSAGFIGYHLVKKLLEDNYEVIGFDNLNSYYDVDLKRARLDAISKLSIKNNYSWKFFKGDLEEIEKLENIFCKFNPKIIIHLAAQAGVRYSLLNPMAYLNSNILGFQNILECSRKYGIQHLLYASSSSVYGGNTKTPFSEKDSVNHPVSIYAASKKSNELFAHAYSHIYQIPVTGMRFFTVYGPWGRPDMAPMIFTNSILNKKPIKIFNNGDMYRDFTYVDDVIKAIRKLIEKPAAPNAKFLMEKPDPSSSWAPFRIFNIGNSKTVSLMKFIGILEKELGEVAIKEFEPIQPGDVKTTSADTSLLDSYIGYKPNTSIEKGIKNFIHWYKIFYNIDLL